LVFRDRVELQLPRLEVFAVATKEENGVIILRIGRSRLAPHRVTKTLVCPVRRSDRCEAMTMREIHCDGLLEFGVVSAFERSGDTNNQLLLSPDWPIVFLANLAVWADRIRSQAHVPTAEYAFDVEIRAIGKPVEVLTGNAGPSWKPSSSPLLVRTSGMLQQGLMKFPRYSLRDAETIPSLLESFNCDFWNSIGLDIGNAERTFAIQDWPSQD